MPSLKCWGVITALVLASPAVAGEVCQPFDKGVKAVAEIAAQGKAQPAIIPPAKMEEFRAMMAKSGIKVYGSAAIILTGQTGTHALFVKLGDKLCRVLPVMLPPDKPAPAKEPDKPEKERFTRDEYGRVDA